MKTLMEKEALESPEIVEKQIIENQTQIKKIADIIREKKPLFAMTIGRGTSDNACNYAKYLIETQMGLVTASAAPSVVTLYKKPLKLQNALVIGVSQSGKSPDICGVMQEAREQGAITIAVLNKVNSPLAKRAEFVIPVHAGEEKAVAATKTFIASLSVIVHLIAEITADSLLLKALKQLPKILEQAVCCDWSQAIPFYQNIIRTYVIARGFSYPIAEEAALKFKETASIHAESFSSADVMHGPLTLVKPSHPLLLFSQQDEMLKLLVEGIKKFNAMGSYPIMGVNNGMLKMYPELRDLLSIALPIPESVHSALDPISQIPAFYPFMANLAVSLGKNPDAPEHLKKVTETI